MGWLAEKKENENENISIYRAAKKIEKIFLKDDNIEY